MKSYAEFGVKLTLRVLSVGLLASGACNLSPPTDDPSENGASLPLPGQGGLDGKGPQTPTQGAGGSAPAATQPPPLQSGESTGTNATPSSEVVNTPAGVSTDSKPAASAMIGPPVSSAQASAVVSAEPSPIQSATSLPVAAGPTATLVPPDVSTDAGVEMDAGVVSPDVE